jgi:hypothetical protein
VFFVDRINAKETVLKKWNQLSESDKNLIRFYLQLSPGDLVRWHFLQRQTMIERNM